MFQTCCANLSADVIISSQKNKCTLYVLLFSFNMSSYTWKIHLENDLQRLWTWWAHEYIFFKWCRCRESFPFVLSLSSAVWRACERSRVRNITADVSSRRHAVDHQNLSFRRPAAPPATRRSTSQRRTARPTSKQTVRVDSGGLAGCSLIFNLCSLRSVGLRANLNNFVQLGDGLPRGSLTLTVGSRLWCLPPRPPL